MKKKTTPFALLTVLVALLCSCATTPHDVIYPADTARAHLIGKWQELRFMREEIQQQFIDLRADGTFEVHGVTYTSDSATSYIWRGKWDVRDAKLVYTTTASIPAGRHRIGETFEDPIESVSEAKWVMKEQSTGKKSYAFRIE